MTAEKIPTRLLGKTGIRLPLLGLGSAPGGLGLPDKVAAGIYHRAIDLGVTHIDTAPGYGRAQEQLFGVLKDRRAEITLATKVPEAEKTPAIASLEKSLETMGVDRVDIAFIHSLGGRDIDLVLSENGSLAGLREAKRRGWTRMIGFTAHKCAWKSVQFLEAEDIDVIMVAVNYADRFTYNFEDLVLPAARRKDVGIIGMKVFGGAQGMDYKTPVPSAIEAQGPHDLKLGLRYALGLPGITSMVVGCYSIEELEQVVSWIRKYEPLIPEEADFLEKLGRETASRLGEHLGPAK